MNWIEDRPDVDWQYEVTERVRDGLRHYGHFNAFVPTSRVRVLRETERTKTVSVTLRVEPGKLYGTGDISFSHSTLFSPAQMRSIFPIRRGDIFETRKIVAGIEALRRAYANHGFINFTEVSSISYDESHNRISVIFDLDEGKQFRVSKFEVLGLDSALAQKLIAVSGLTPGHVFNARLLGVFFQRNKALLPRDANAEDDTRRAVDERTGTVNLTIDVRGCPPGKVY